MIATLDRFPMRPQMARKLTPGNVLEVANSLRRTHCLQPKLNGDRVLLVKDAGRVGAFSRFGKPYSFSVRAASDWADLPDGTMLDGEGWEGRFWPFEVVREGMAQEERIEEAKRICLTLGHPWIFDEPTDAWMLLGEANLPQWEGFVAKERGALYEWLNKPAHDSWAWLKCKW